MSDSNPSLATLNVVQEVLRCLMVSLAAASKADSNQLSMLLSAAAQDPRLDKLSRDMLDDLGVGAQTLAQMSGQQRTGH